MLSNSSSGLVVETLTDLWLEVVLFAVAVICYAVFRKPLAQLRIVVLRAPSTAQDGVNGADGFDPSPALLHERSRKGTDGHQRNFRNFTAARSRVRLLQRRWR